MDTAAQIRRYLEEHSALSNRSIQLTDDTLLLEEKILDSVGMLELLLFIEETFGLQVPEEDIAPDHFGTVKKLAAYVDSHRSQFAQ
jgi:acyl carrier protein